MQYETIRYEVAEHVATVTLARPDVLNSFNQPMLDEFKRMWKDVRLDDDVRAVVVRADGDRAFSTGADVNEGIFLPENVWSQIDPGTSLGAKQNDVWKPVICAVQGMVAAGAFYVVNESDIVICSDDAMFFDPHVSYGMVAACEPIGLAWRMPLGEVLRLALLGLDERMSAQRAREIGFVTEITDRATLWDRAAQLAAIVAAKPTAATQGTVRAIWETRGVPPLEAQKIGMVYTRLGNPLGQAEFAKEPFTRPKWQLR